MNGKTTTDIVYKTAKELSLRVPYLIFKTLVMSKKQEPIIYNEFLTYLTHLAVTVKLGKVERLKTKKHEFQLVLNRIIVLTTMLLFLKKHNFSIRKISQRLSCTSQEDTWCSGTLL